jgi:hypothetical protein
MVSFLCFGEDCGRGIDGNDAAVEYAKLSAQVQG